MGFVSEMGENGGRMENEIIGLMEERDALKKQVRGICESAAKLR